MEQRQPPTTPNGISSSSYESEPRQGVLSGPSEGIEAWGNWLIDFHKRWHEGDPKRGWRALLGAGWWLLALVAIIEKVAGG